MKNSVLIGNGTFSLSHFFHQLQNQADVIAVDGGANICRENDIIPQKIIGDLDSITDENKKYFIEKKCEIIHIPEQNSSDLEKALRTIDSENFYCFAFTGNFFDHELSLLHILQKNFSNNYGKNKKIFMFSQTQIFFVLPENGEIKFNNTLKKNISFYPLTKTFFTYSSGLQYSLQNIELEQGKMIGTSNSSTDEKISWKIKTGCCIGLFPIKYSMNILQSLYDTSFH